jgi:hypothetical protein
MRNGKANIARHKSSAASTTRRERNQATQKINQHRDDQDRTDVDCQDVAFTQETDTTPKLRTNRFKCLLPPITCILIKPAPGGIIASSAFRRSLRRPSIAWSSRISLVGASTSPSGRALRTASDHDDRTLASLRIGITIKPQTLHVLRHQSGQGNQRSVLMVELRDGDIQLEGDNLWTQRISRNLLVRI